MNCVSMAHSSDSYSTVSTNIIKRSSVARPAALSRSSSSRSAAAAAARATSAPASSMSTGRPHTPHTPASAAGRPAGCGA